MNRLVVLRALFASAAVLLLWPRPDFALQAHQARATDEAQADERDGQHDFDWEIGKWSLHVKRLEHPLSGSAKWLDLDGTVIVREVWNGLGNLAEIEVHGGGSRIEFLSLRLYNQQSHQWSMNFSTSGTGTLSQPMIGQFRNGQGEFYDQEMFKGRAIFVRFVFVAVSPDSGRSEQAFSTDGGKTWEVNWINTYTRVRD